jgi:hypothetical protein
MLSESESVEALNIPEATYVWESKIDGSNVGLSFLDGKPRIQNRSHFLTGGEHPQYDLLRNWIYTVMPVLQPVLGERYIMFGEWAYAKHSIFYPRLKHYFHEFDILDQETGKFLDTELRNMACDEMVRRRMLVQVPVIHVGRLKLDEARALMDHRPIYGEDRPEGLYLKIEKSGEVIGRYKLVHDEFIQAIIDGDEHWKNKPIVKNELIEGLDITRPD